MNSIDLSKNTRIPILLDMIGSIRRARTAREILEAFLCGMQMAYGPRCYVGISLKGCGPDEYRIVRWLTLEDGDQITPGDIGEEILEKPVLRGGFLGNITSTPEPKLIHDLSISDDPVVRSRLARYGSMIAVPLIEADLSVAWALLFHEGRQTFTTEDLETMIVRANLINATVDNVLVHQKLIEATAEIQREIDQIASIQKSLLPRKLPDIPGVTLAASYKTFDRAGGDYYDVFPVSRLYGNGNGNASRWLILIADAAGHGPSAAVLMAVFHSILHTYSAPAAGPAEVLEYINRHLYERFDGMALMTAFMGFYEPQTHRLLFANAGHNLPLLRQPGAEVQIDELEISAGIPLGVQQTAGLAESLLVLRPGQTLLMYTDGVIDERSSDGLPFELHRVREALMRQASPQELVDDLNNQLIIHQGLTPPEDDQTLLVMQVG